MESIKDNIVGKVKSSSRFGDLFVTKNWQELLKERRFLFFTKRGPIEVVFNIKHYLSGFALTILVAFKIIQFIFFGVLHIVSIMMMQNNSIQTKQFTESEVKALKDLAGTVIDSNTKEVNSDIKNNSEKGSSIFIQEKNNSLSKIKDAKNDFEESTINLREKATSKIDDLVEYFNDFKFSFQSKNNDESIFDDFSGLANPHMVPIEQTLGATKNKILEPIEQEKVEYRFSYNSLPIVPYAAPRNNKTKMVQFSKTIDLEILELVNVFKTLKLQPDNIDTSIVDEFTRNNLLLSKDSELIDQLSSRFNYLDKLKEAIIFLPLKPPMQYYYVSSPFGMRVHPKTKKKQMHKGIDMAGTWQEEVRSSANGKVIFSGRFGSFGKVIKIKHKHGVETLYGHLHKILVKKGDEVEEGQIIGKMGATGRVAGAHLHYEIKVNKKSVNPYNFISLGRNLVSSSIIK